MAGKEGTTAATAAPKAPGAVVVEALGNSFAAGFASAALEEAEVALRGVYVHPNGDGEERPLTPMQKTTLAALRSLGSQIVTATTVPTSADGEGVK